MIRIVLVLLSLSWIHAQTTTRYRPLTNSETDDIVKWGIKEMHHLNNDVCWKDRYANGFGEERVCKNGFQQEGLMCYETCKPGYESTKAGLFCRKSCPSEFRSEEGIFCRKPPAYRRKGRSCLKGFKCRCDSDEEKNGLMCYPKCRTGYKSMSLAWCSPRCPSGFNDIGISCKKPSYRRAVSVRNECRSGLVRKPNGLRCFEPCREGFHGIGPICRSGCGGGQPHDCGLLCAEDRGRCAMATFDMVLSPLVIVANLLTYGGASKVAGAAKVLTKKNLIDPVQIRRIAKFFQDADVLTRQAAIADQVVQDLITAFEPGIDTHLSGPLATAYGPDNAAKLIREMSIGVTFMIIAKSLAEIGLTVASFVDPTGIVAVIEAFGQPKCRKPSLPPVFDNLFQIISGVTDAPTVKPTAPPLPPVIVVNVPERNATEPDLCLDGTPILKCSLLNNPTPAQTCTGTCDASDGMVCLQQACRACNVTCVFDPTLCTFNPCDDPEIQALCEPGTCKPDFTVSCDHTCTPRGSTPGRTPSPDPAPSCTPPDNEEPPSCDGGEAEWDTLTCTWKCVFTCPNEATPIMCAETTGCSSWNSTQKAACQSPYQCVEHVCPPIVTGTTCVTTCQFNPELCQEEPCLSQQAIEACVEGTCANDFTSGCNYQCTTKARSALVTSINFIMTWGPETTLTPKPLSTSHHTHTLAVDVVQTNIPNGALRCVRALRSIASLASISNITLIDARSIVLVDATQRSWNVTVGFIGDDDTRARALDIFFYYINASVHQLFAMDVLLATDAVFHVDEETITTSQLLLDQQTCTNGTAVSAFDTCPAVVSTPTSTSAPTGTESISGSDSIIVPPIIYLVLTITASMVSRLFSS